MGIKDKKIKSQILLLIALVISLLSCDTEIELSFDLTEGKDYNLFDYYEDPYGNQGIVIAVAYTTYSDQPNEQDLKYIIVMSLDESYDYWGPIKQQIYRKDSISTNIPNQPAYGVAMLQTMCAIGIDYFPAQAWCYEKNKQEIYPHAGSWRLPSTDEIYTFSQKSSSHLIALNKQILKYRGVPLKSNEMYWTCTEDYENYVHFNYSEAHYNASDRAIACTPIYNSIEGKKYWNKSEKHYVRAIKYIYYNNVRKK